MSQVIRPPVAISRIEQVATRWYITAAPGTKPEHVAEPDYYQHVARMLKPHDEIRIVAADGSFDIEVRVVAVDPRKSWAQVAHRLAFDLPPAMKPLPPEPQQAV